MNGSPRTVRAVWSDFGGVLTPPIAETFTAFCGRVGVSAQALLDGMVAVADELGMPLMAPLDTATLTEAEWGRRVAEHVEAATGIRHDFARFSTEWFRDRPTNAEMVDVLRQLRARGYAVGMLTNNVKEWEPHWRAMLPVEDVFDAVLNSCDIGVRKPDPAMYELAERRFGLAPQECLLIDDLPENTAGARARGWQTITFTDNASALRALEPLLSTPVRTAAAAVVGSAR